MKIRFLTPAEIEMFEASAYYEMQATELGINFLKIIEEAINKIVKNPQDLAGNRARDTENNCAPISVFRFVLYPRR